MSLPKTLFVKEVRYANNKSEFIGLTDKRGHAALNELVGIGKYELVETVQLVSKIEEIPTPQGDI